MNWFFIALIYPISHALANHLDKYILSKYLKGFSIGALVLLTSFFGFLSLPIILFINPGALLGASFLEALILASNGGVLILAVTCYFHALFDDEASFVAPLFQLIPIFGFVLGYFVLGETLLPVQMLAAGLIIAGGAFLSINLAERKAKIKTRLLLLMTTSSFLYAVNGVVFKSIAAHQGFLDSLFWDMAGKFIVGTVLFIAAASYRHDLITLIKTNRLPILALCLLTEILALSGEVSLILALLFAPVALVQSVGGLQPLFVLILGIIITLLFPRFGKESLEKKSLVQKIAGVAIVTAGVYFLGG